MQRKQVKHATSLEERLAADAEELRKRAAELPAGLERDRLLQKARQDDTAAHMTALISSPGLRPPE